MQQTEVKWWHDVSNDSWRLVEEVVFLVVSISKLVIMKFLSKHLFRKRKKKTPWCLSRFKFDTDPSKWVISVVLPILKLTGQASLTIFDRPRGLPFTCWVCCGLCFRHKPAELAHSFLFCSCVCFRLWPFNCSSFRKFSRQLSAFSLCSSNLPYWSYQLYISLWKSPSALI